MKLKKDALTDLLRQAEAQKIFNRAVAGFILPDGSRETLTLNTPEDTVFDIASLTKVCPTSTLALSYILEGKLSIDTKVIDYIPELQTNYREDIRIFHLLTHSLDYRVPMKTLRTLSPEGILNALYTYQFEKSPGADFNYGNPASVLLGIILQRLTGKDLQQQGRERFFVPLGMNRSGWDPLSRDWNPIPKAEISPTEICSFRNREIHGEIHDESAWVLRKLFPVGSAGMFSCVPDLLNFVQMILNDGKAGGVQVAPAGILKMVSENAFEGESASKYSNAKEACTALGWELNSEKFMGNQVSPHTFGKTGFTGASIVADPEQGAAVVLLSNFTYPHREINADRIHAFRATLSNEFFKNLRSA
jgi:CubicO group peptidase (beta-lactamase class C family)